jgi:L-2-hydroxyglutarate oxidase
LTCDYAILGGGIVGLATALALKRRTPGAGVLVLEKEADWALHQTGRNSGVLHTGIYYRPGSRKARLAAAGRRAMVAFCREHGIPHEICGTVIVAVGRGEVPALLRLHRRGLENGVDARLISGAEAREREPHVRARAAILVPEAGIVDFRAVALRMAALLRDAGAELRTGTRVTGIREGTVETDRGEFAARTVVNCAGLHCDRVARLAGLRPPARIVPFRGEYWDLARRHLVKHLVYPVPDPAFPFLGVHVTRSIHGNLHCGPNAVLAMKREGYRRGDFDWRDVRDIVTFGGFWKLVARHGGQGAREIARSLSRRAFARSVQRLVPEVREEDLLPAESGVRAQAVADDGRLVDDFLLVRGPQSLHVLNAPSPAATASLAIGEEIAQALTGP